MSWIFRADRRCVGGGGAVWDGFAYDPEANLVYVGTGNAEPWVQKFRGAQNLDNLYTCSILAVDLTTGQLKWYYQTVPNDNWDYDSVQQLMLLDLNINGRMRKVITQAPKNGFFYVLDRVTGKVLLGKPFTDTPWARELGPDGHPIILNNDGSKVCIPDNWGGTNFMPPSFDPALRLFFVTARETCATYLPEKLVSAPGRIFLSGTIRRDLEKA